VGAARKFHVRRALGGGAHPDPNMQELKVRVEQTRRRKSRVEYELVGIAAAERNQDGFHDKSPSMSFSRMASIRLLAIDLNQLGFAASILGAVKWGPGCCQP
jgi:hypothetical protein